MGWRAETQLIAKEKEKEENVWRREIFGQNRGRKGEKFGEGKYLISIGEKERRRKRRKTLDIGSCHGLVT